MEKCDVHEVEIKTLKKDMEDMREKVDDILERVSRPLLSTEQVTKLVIGFIFYTVIVSFYISNTNSLSVENQKQIIEIKQEKKETEKKIDKIYDIVVQTNQDVAVLKSK